MEIQMIVVSIHRFVRDGIPLRMVALSSDDEYDNGYLISAGMGALTKDRENEIPLGKKVKVTVEEL